MSSVLFYFFLFFLICSLSLSVLLFCSTSRFCFILSWYYIVMHFFLLFPTILFWFAPFLFSLCFSLSLFFSILFSLYLSGHQFLPVVFCDFLSKRWSSVKSPPWSYRPTCWTPYSFPLLVPPQVWRVPTSGSGDPHTAQRQHRKWPHAHQLVLGKCVFT